MAKLRKITVQNNLYLWRLGVGYITPNHKSHPKYEQSQKGNVIDKDAPIDYRSLYQLYICADNYPNSGLHLSFMTWEDPSVGGPLHSGASLDLKDPNSPRVNLHKPRWIARLIELALKKGWQPQAKNMSIEEATPWLYELHALGYT